MGYYKGIRKSGLFDPKDTKPYRLSRSRLDVFLNCPRCFYLDRRLGIDRLPGFPFALNSAVDKLLKAEFDQYRESGKPHPLMVKYGIDAVPFKHEKMDEWRDALRRGIQYLHKPSNFLVTGGVDDVWLTPKGELIIVDYKATSKESEVSLDADWQIGYKRQMEIYQWLFRQNGFRVQKIGYFVYCNGLADRGAFNAKLDFDIKLISYEGNDAWVDSAISAARSCLTAGQIPVADSSCDYCKYVALASTAKPERAYSTYPEDPQEAILDFLAKRKPANLKQLSHALGLPGAALRRHLAELQAKKLIATTGLKADSPTVFFRLYKKD